MPPKRPKPRPRKRPTSRKATVIIAAWEIRAARADGAATAAMLGRVVQQIAQFCREARLDVDAERRVLEMRLAEVEDKIAEDSVSWSPGQRAVAPHLQNRDDAA